MSGMEYHSQDIEDVNGFEQGVNQPGDNQEFGAYSVGGNRNDFVPF